VEESNTCPMIVVPSVLFSEVKRFLVIIQNFLEQQEKDIFAIESKLSSLHKQISTIRANIGVQTTLDAYFQFQRLP
jgi:hypothetical protein